MSCLLSFVSRVTFHARKSRRSLWRERIRLSSTMWNDLKLFYSDHRPLHPWWIFCIYPVEVLQRLLWTTAASDYFHIKLISFEHKMSGECFSLTDISKNDKENDLILTSKTWNDQLFGIFPFQFHQMSNFNADKQTWDICLASLLSFRQSAHFLNYIQKLQIFFISEEVRQHVLQEVQEGHLDQKPQGVLAHPENKE